MSAGDFPRGDIEEGPLLPALPQRRAGDSLPAEQRDELLAIRAAKLGTESCGHLDAHHGVAGEPGYYACDECGTTWVDVDELRTRSLTTGDPVLYSGPSPDLDGKTGVVVSRLAGDKSVIDVEIDGCRWSIPASRLTLVEPGRRFEAGNPVLVDNGREGVVTSVHDGYVWVSVKDPLVNTGWRPANGYYPADVQHAPVVPADAAVPSLVQLDLAEAAARFASTSDALIMLPAEVDRTTRDAAFAAARAALDELEEASR